MPSWQRGTRLHEWITAAYATTVAGGPLSCLGAGTLQRPTTIGAISGLVVSVVPDLVAAAITDLLRRAE